MGLHIILTIIFIVFKLTNIIDWTWLWVLSPFWINFIINCIIELYFKLFD